MPRKKKTNTEDLPDVPSLEGDDDDLGPTPDPVDPAEAIAAELAGRKAAPEPAHVDDDEDDEPAPSPLVSAAKADDRDSRIAELEARLSSATAREAELERRLQERDRAALRQNSLTEEAIAAAWEEYGQIKMPPGHPPFRLRRDKTLINISKSPITFVGFDKKKYTAPVGALIPMDLCPQWQRWVPRYFIQFRGDPRGKQAVVPGFSKRHSSY